VLARVQGCALPRSQVSQA